MTEYINYLNSSHGVRIENDYIELPSGIRVIMLCTDSSCPISFIHEKALITLAMNNISPELDNLERIWYRTKKFGDYNFCVFSGNIDDDFARYMPACRGRTFNFAPNINLDPETENMFRDGIFKLPMRPKIVSTINNKIISNTDEVITDFQNLTPENDDTNKASILINPDREQYFNAKLDYDSDYISFHPEKDKNYPSIQSLGIRTLRDLIEYLKKKESFDSKKCMMTIFVSACLSRLDAINPQICMISLNTYTRLNVNLTHDNIDYNNIPASRYDTILANTKRKIKNFSDLANKLNYTFTHALSGKTDENSVYTQNNSRIYKDESTSAYVKNMFRDKNAMMLFLDYTYNTINLMLKTQINKYLTEKKQLPLMGDENIYFVFKGGNVMNYFMELHLSNIEEIFENVSLQHVVNQYGDEGIIPYTDVNNQNNTGTYASYFSLLKEYFKISDVDYSLYVKASNNARFVLIHGMAIQILSKILSIIAAKFDEMYYYMDTPYNSTITPITDDELGDSDPYLAQYSTLKNIIMHPQLLQYLNILFLEQPVKNQTLKDYLKNREKTIIISVLIDNLDRKYLDDLIYSLIEASNFVNDIDDKSISILNFTKINQLATMIQYLHTIKYLNIRHDEFVINVDNLVRLETQLQEYLKKFLDDKYSKLRISNFYSNDKFNAMKSDLANGLNKLIGQVKYTVLNDGLKSTINEYRLVSNCDQNDIIYKPRGNFICKSTDNPILQQSLFNAGDYYLHYITFNNLIKSLKKANTNNFDLMRIKFNTELINVAQVNDVTKNIKIPSECIDISIPFYDDSGYEKFMEHFSLNNNLINIKNTQTNISIILQSYNLEDVYHDLIYVLFQQNYYLPWIDPKYAKRVIRLLFTGIVNAYNQDSINNETKLMDNFIDLFLLSRIMLTYLTDLNNNKNPKYPYDACTQFIHSTNNSEEYARTEIDNIIIKNKKLVVYQLLYIDPKYQYISDMVSFIIIFTRLLTFSEDEIYYFINKNRSDYSFTPIPRNKIREYITDINNNLINILNIFIDNGYKILFMYQFLFYFQSNNYALRGGFGNLETQFRNLQKRNNFIH